MNSPILRTEMKGLTALPVEYLEESRLRQTVEKVGMDAIEFGEKKEGAGKFYEDWYRVFFIDSRLSVLKGKRRLEIN